jgi:hypothetical protein
MLNSAASFESDSHFQLFKQFAVLWQLSEPCAFVYSLAHLPFAFMVRIYKLLSAYNSARAPRIHRDLLKTKLKVERNCIPVLVHLHPLLKQFFPTKSEFSLILSFS